MNLGCLKPALALLALAASTGVFAQKTSLTVYTALETDQLKAYEAGFAKVNPDIEIENQPQDVARGVDAQLDRAIQEVMKLHETNPPIVPKFGPVRNRTRDVYLEKEIAGAKSSEGSDGTRAAKSPRK